MATRKILREVAIKIEVTPGTFLDGDVRLPWTSGGMGQQFNLIQDESITGIAHMGLPNQGVRDTPGNFTVDADVVTIEPVLEAVFGAVAAQVYSFPSDKNVKTLSIGTLDDQKYNKYGGAFLNNFSLESEAEGRLVYSFDVVGFTAEVRAAVGGFPSSLTEAGVKILHHHMDTGASGYFRVGDQANALVAGDNTTISQVALGANWNFANQYSNLGKGTLIPLSGGGGRPEASFSFTVSRHDADTFLAFRDAATPLQAQYLYFQASTAQVLVQVPNFLVETVEIPDEDIPGVVVTCMVARNGIGATFDNTQMAFNTAARITITNS